MKKIKLFGLLLLFAAAMSFTACSDDDLSSTSIFPEQKVEDSKFNNWLTKNYVQPYNIDFKYRYSDKESDRNYNVIPAKYENAIAIAKLMKYMWIDSYVECAGREFLCTYTPRVIQLTGSYKYDTNGPIVAGSAEQGMKVMLYGVNDLDLDNVYVNTTDPYANHYAKPLDLNYLYFHTMHHEFCHILTQTKNYSTDFQTISAGGYHSTDWVNVKDKDAAKEGFVSGYASGEYNEDFAETYAFYVTMSAEGWQKILDQAGEKGAAIINKKLDIVRSYFAESWGIDLDKMRAILMDRSAKVTSLDLRSLDD